MRIAQIAPLHEAVPPKLYGGTERVVSYLTEALVEQGHDVTLFASGDSQTSAKLEAFWPQALRLDPTIRDVMAPHMLLLEEVRRRADEFDVLHFHIDYYPFSLFARQPVPFLTTLHGRLDLPELQPIFNTFSDVPVVSISDNQRIPPLGRRLRRRGRDRETGVTRGCLALAVGRRSLADRVTGQLGTAGSGKPHWHAPSGR